MITGRGTALPLCEPSEKYFDNGQKGSVTWIFMKSVLKIVSWFECYVSRFA